MSVDFQIIKRYLDGKGKQEDLETILSWFSGDETQADLRDQYYHYWNDLTGDNPLEGYDEEKMLGKIYHEIKLEESKLAEKQRKLRVRSMVANYLTRVAAVLFIPMTIIAFMNWQHSVKTASYPVYSEIYAPKGTHTKFNLPDGSSGYLNGGSKVRFPTVFAGDSREVNLDGEAYFDVRTNPDKPFVVSGQHIKVIAYGTAFNVEAYPEDRIEKVTLVKGKVEVRGGKEGHVKTMGVLTPGEMCVFDKKNFSGQFVEVDAEKVVSWKDGKLMFVNEPFEEVVRKLNRRYGVNITIGDEKLKDYTYLATFVEDETLDEVLKLLALSAPIEVTDLGRKIQPDGSYGERTIEFSYRAGK